MISSKQTKGLRLMLAICAVAPLRSTYILALMLLAGLAEGIGIVSFLPLLTSIGMGSGSAAGGNAAGRLSVVARPCGRPAFSCVRFRERDASAAGSVRT